ncbi:simple sugar transport system permease protein [Trueperella bonasi]|uniref:Simple sugar transport system permease protein n=1 Tax=Trueperella bonasi TaxID=312286 RepID=A0ABT9NEH6_9ACTO|nr:ABC transporter permease [Trueperella bonasi]MDP9805793.1 simple sugar transport system permease protein [Trueperella bonasi]
MSHKQARNDVPVSAWLKGLAYTGLRSGWLVSVLAVVIAFAIGALLIAMSGASVAEAYYNMFRGAIFNPEGRNLAYQIKPLTDSLFYAIPLILGGLGLAFGFRAGLFNIGGAGQLIFGALAAAWVGFNYDFPPVIHTLLAVLAGMIAGGLYASIAGILKARTGANEVIVTIMLNSISGLALSYILLQPSWQVPGTNFPKTPNVADSAAMTPLLDPPFKIHSGIILAIIATFVFWWLLERSTFGFEVRAVGANPDAARTSGISVGKVTVLTMVVSGAYLGMAGANEALGTIGYVSGNVAGNVGFDAITVALLGRNKPIGTFFAGLLFGAFKAGGYLMQNAGVPIDMILILQSTIVLLIAAPALVRWLFRLPQANDVSLRQFMTLSQRGVEVNQANADALENEELPVRDESRIRVGEEPR